MDKALPLTVNPQLLARQAESLVGTLPLADLPRLKTALVSCDGGVAVLLNFMQNERGHVCITGTLSARLQLPCDRCAKSMTCDVQTSLNLMPVITDAQADKLPSPFEPVFLKDKVLSISALVEEELLLALPMVVTHPDGECSLCSN